jgi:hypothetical protein
MRAVQAAQSGQGVQSGDVPGHEHRPGARAGRREPEGDRRAQRRRAGDLDTDADRGQGRRDRAAADEQHRTALRAAGPQPTGQRAGEPPTQRGNRGRTHDHPCEPHRVHQQHLGRRPQAKPAQQGSRLVRHAGADRSRPDDADLAVDRRYPGEHRSGALVTRNLGLGRHARDERRRQRDAQRRQQPAGWAPPPARGGQHQWRKPGPHDPIVAPRRHPLGVSSPPGFLLAICLDFRKMRYIVKIVVGERMGRTGGWRTGVSRLRRVWTLMT